jgi:phosphatidylserine decarboxylase
MRTKTIHQYIERGSASVVTEDLFCDNVIGFLYGTVRENAQVLFNALISARVTHLLAFFNYDLSFRLRLSKPEKIIKRLGIDMDECLDPPEALTSPKKIFERKIRFWENRPMPTAQEAIVSPADSKMLAGSFESDSIIFLKEKFFHFEELIGKTKKRWLDTFRVGNFAVFRLTPEKYHYNHFPVSGEVVDIYEIDGAYHSCNPRAVITEATPFSKNRRVVTIIDTDVPGGTRIGLVAMVEVVALMIGDILQCYSKNHYSSPRRVSPGLFVKKGQPKSLYRPGSSVDILIFQRGKMVFCDDILSNMRRAGASSRFSIGFGKSLVETDVKVRSKIGEKA